MGPSVVWLAYLAWPIVTLVTGSSLLYWIYSNRWDRRGARWFAGVLGVGAFWMAATFLHLWLGDPGLQRVVAIVEAILLFASFAAYIVFVSVYTGREFHERRSVQATLVGVMGSLLVLAPLNFLGVTNLLWTDLVVVDDPFPYVVIEHGVGLVVILTVLLGLIGYSWFVLTNYLLATGTGSGTQVLLILLGGLSIGVAELLGQAGLLPADGLHHATFGALPYVVFSTFGLFRFDLLDVLPVARNAVVEYLTDPVLVLDDDRRLVDYNAAALDTWPALPEKKGAPFAAAFPSLADRIELPADRKAATTDRLTLAHDGTEHHYSVTTTPITRGRSGAVGWYAILFRDVTDLEQSRWQLQKQNERLDQVATTISHDLRNPIAVASGQTESLALELDEWDVTPEHRDRAQGRISSTQDSLDRMEDIVEDILTLAREGKTVEETGPVELGATARDAWANVDTDDATLTVAGDRRLQADRSNLLSIFENLFRNSVEHGPDDGTVEVGATADGFYVADDGPGIPDEHAGDIFEYGYTTSGDGTGLGLSIVRTMAESHGWTVELDREYERGTRFVFGSVDTVVTDGGWRAGDRGRS
ncbi:PAS fold-containing protein [Halorientalis persicus]|uniref:histidine kinase n=1 Tax=Halorientalis persicus TaxID=1367881 RepID=A0A1H8LHM1_9EURY|nr:ATP-binding protein [Halorientalis persicus]SEO04543.1 PAS fold-containing protein [Halorientalis persicus]